MPVDLPRVVTNVQTFFNKSQVVSNLDRLERRALSRAGAYVAETAKRSIRKQKGSARPGEIPHSHTGKLRDMIRSGVDSNNLVAVAGALPRFDVESMGLAPSALEHGGRTMFKPSKGRKYRPGDIGILRLGEGKTLVTGADGSQIPATVGKIETHAQLARANDNLQKLNGLGTGTRSAVIAARPFMNPALIRSKTYIDRFFEE